MDTLFALIYLLEFTTMGAIVFAMREKIVAGLYGVRYKKWQEIDTGRRGYVILDKALDSCTINGMKKSVCRSNISHGIMYFVSDVAENLKIEDARDRYQCYMNSEEFDTVYKNKLLSTLMLSLQNNYLLIILALVGLGVGVGIYNAYSLSQQATTLEYIAWRVNQSYAP